MAKQVCQIAYDQGLLATREMLLRDAGYQVTSFLGNQEAMKGIKSDCDLFVLGHATHRAAREEMLGWLKHNFPASQVIVLYPGAASEQRLQGADHHSVYDNPAEWLAAIDQVLGPR